MTENSLWEKAKQYLKDSRVPHVLGCESEAVKLAERWGEDTDKASTAALLHDITKKCSYEDNLELIKKYGLELDENEMANPKLLHAKTGAALAADVFNIGPEIAEAIKWHTTGKPNMTLLEKIIYLADYIEPTRDFDGVEELRKLAYQDINKCMALGLKMSLEEVSSRGTKPHKNTREAFEYYAVAK